jgi:hypothetical protein
VQTGHLKQLLVASKLMLEQQLSLFVFLRIYDTHSKLLLVQSYWTAAE